MLVSWGPRGGPHGGPVEALLRVIVASARFPSNAPRPMVAQRHLQSEESRLMKTQLSKMTTAWAPVRKFVRLAMPAARTTTATTTTTTTTTTTPA
eukprot:8276967-Pyramimonas_sp.AAC.1